MGVQSLRLGTYFIYGVDEVMLCGYDALMVSGAFRSVALML